jgi:transposase
MPQVSTYVGLDVHKKSISAAFANAEAGSTAVFYSRMPNDFPILLRWLRKLGAPETVKVCYESGPTGYRLYRELRAAGFDCVVIVPALTPKKPGDRVKTDRIDALRLAECLRNGQLKAIRVPTEEEEALRDLLRAREDLKGSETNLRRQISALMLRHGHARTLYLEQLQRYEERLEQLEQSVLDAALKLPSRDLFRAFMALKGVKVITAASLIAEIGDFRRFPTAAKFMSFLGLVPSIHASGESVRRGAITKAGNGRLRRLLMEAAWAYFRTPHVSRELTKRSEGVSTEARDISWEAQVRLYKRMKMLMARGKHQKTAIVAVARELAGFMWAMGQQDRLVTTAV